MFSRCMTYTL